MYFNNIILATKDYVEIILKHLQGKYRFWKKCAKEKQHWKIINFHLTIY